MSVSADCRVIDKVRQEGAAYHAVDKSDNAAVCRTATPSVFAPWRQLTVTKGTNVPSLLIYNRIMYWS